MTNLFAANDQTFKLNGAFSIHHLTSHAVIKLDYELIIETLNFSIIFKMMSKLNLPAGGKRIEPAGGEAMKEFLSVFLLLTYFIIAHGQHTLSVNNVNEV